MKKLAFFFFCLVFAFSAKAQFMLSPIAGLNFSNMTASSNAFYKTYTVLRYYIGVQPSYDINEKFNVGAGVQFATKGYRWGDIGSTSETELRIGYLEFTPYAMYKPVKIIGIYAGASLGYQLDEKIKNGGKWRSPFFDFSEKYDFGGVVGIKLFAKNIFVNLGLFRSLVPINEINLTDENGEILENVKQFNQLFSIGVGYNFHLKKK
ncbi:MAG: PorT family protein [Saprospiraceae bacterium]|nr:PorT family protein [Saprospiraceae bacterium]MCF8250794.1 PorT family protein [Saprospiraceae bacterium]MCF8283014.1 PorT family protein [Bacteroidales bacterium]MCF8312595.1 PorT family protein [Saprospiraceae bacterium]MCF8440924.1 PorT family protein [Saprospiraceae bacterium]